MKRVLVKSVLLALCISFAGTQSALAYIDPNTGGLLFQVLAVAFASFSAVVLIFSRQIRALFARTRRAFRALSKNQPEFTGDSNPVSSASTEKPLDPVAPADQSVVDVDSESKPN